MKTLYLDIFSGISGDMFLGALIDLGVDAHALEHELEKLGVAAEYHIHVARTSKAHIAGVKFDVHGPHDHAHHHDHGHEHHHEHTHDHDHAHGHSHSHTHEHGHHEDGHSHEHKHDEHDHGHGRNYADIKKLIRGSSLSPWVKEKSVAVFHRIAVAEGKVHGMDPEKVHFHEVGAIDSIVDIVGACIALEMLGKPRVLAAPVVEGTGWIQCAHGRFPIPAPATLNILGERGVALTQCDEPHELVTPTGAALLAEFVETFGPMRGLVAEKVGFGLGTRDNHTRPNVVRAVLGRVDSASNASSGAMDWETDTIAVLETNLDDISAELLGHFVERALAAGALDVFHTPIQMKKNRPGVLLTVLCPEADANKFAELILRETTAFGVRRTIAERRKLHRETVTVQTPHGPVAVKLGKLGGKIVQIAPEFESCKAAADKAGAPIRDVFEAARESARRH